jgi:hypothetical protein
VQIDFNHGYGIVSIDTMARKGKIPPNLFGGTVVLPTVEVDRVVIIIIIIIIIIVIVINRERLHQSTRSCTTFTTPAQEGIW